MHPALLCLSLLIVSALQITPGIPKDLELRVVSFNAWGLPIGTPSRKERVQAIPAYLAPWKPDVVAMQELWVGEDVLTLAAAFKEQGLIYQLRADDELFGGGLFLASRFPIESSSFLRFEARGKAAKVWHADFYAGKGAQITRLLTPSGALVFVNTHLQAAYGSTEYLPEQLSQVLQLRDALSAPMAPSWAHGLPMILVGDINSRHDQLAAQLLETSMSLAPLREGQGIDAMYSRSGLDLQVTSLGGEYRLARPVAIPGLTEALPLSDHAAAWGCWKLMPLSGERDSAKVEVSIPLEVAKKAQDVLEQGRSNSRTQAFVFLVLAAALVFWLQRSQRKLLARLAIGAALGLAVLCTGHELWRAGNFSRALERLGNSNR